MVRVGVLQWLQYSLAAISGTRNEWASLTHCVAAGRRSATAGVALHNTPLCGARFTRPREKRPAKLTHADDRPAISVSNFATLPCCFGREERSALFEKFLNFPKELSIGIFHRDLMLGGRWLTGRFRLGRFGQALSHRSAHFIKERVRQLNAAAVGAGPFRR